MKNKFKHFATHLLLLSRSTLCSCFGYCELQYRVVGFLYFRVSLHSDTKM